MGEAGFQGSLWAERPLSSAVMTSGPWRLMCGGTSAPRESPAPPARSRTRTAAQSQQVRPARIRWRTRPLPEAPAAGAVAVSTVASDPLGRRGRAAPRPRPVPPFRRRGGTSPHLRGSFLPIPGAVSLPLLLVSVTALIWPPEGRTEPLSPTPYFSLPRICAFLFKKGIFFPEDFHYAQILLNTGKVHVVGHGDVRLEALLRMINYNPRRWHLAARPPASSGLFW